MKTLRTEGFREHRGREGIGQQGIDRGEERREREKQRTRQLEPREKDIGRGRYREHVGQVRNNTK